ncbi:MAG: response regulator [Candidatus Eisenbacteria bacterium]|uniref:Response regulator n=1 Tax=Eiseniibacteriota bacterium TaxID=2212470 RepID=A0A538SC91_UNCEI|nr:MAG: response regulator [Candidatus Eisenbacteria bacterium]
MNAREPGRRLQILLVEDNPADVRLTAEVWKETGLQHGLSVVQNGEEGLAFLRREGKYASAPRPDIVLLDLNLPRKDGRELLAEMKADPRIRQVPVVVLTTSNAHQDIVRSYDLHANCYVVKPVGFEQFLQVIRSITDFWVNVAVLPASER